MSAPALPALLGGPPACPQGPPPWPLPDESVWHALQAAYADGSWGLYHGGAVERLEALLARYHGVEFAVTCASGTFAVEVALRALKVGPGDEVIMAAYDYGGNFLGVHAIGARPVLVDVAADNWNLDPARLEAAVGPATRAVIASHLHGGVVPMRQVMEVARRHGLAVIEDAAQMPGAVVQGRMSGTWGDAGILSFGGSKLLTAGRGGALVTNRADVYQRARLLLHRGNLVCPLSELQAAVLVPQLERLDDRNAVRAGNVPLLGDRLQAIPGLRLLTNSVADTRPGYYKLGWQFDADRFGLSRARFLAAVRAEGVALDEGFPALHVGRSPSRFRAAGALDEASRAHAGAVVLHHPVLLGTEPQLEEVAYAIHKVHAHSEPLGRVSDS
jgi:dTDP-4-amino-4,6-dideoxygalactose transaminase